MCLLIGGVSALGAHLANKLENLGELFLSELKAKHDTLMDEIVFKDEFVILWIEHLIDLLYGETLPLELLPEFVDQSVRIVEALVELEAPCGV